jgi:hypothetical protein
VNGIVHFVLLTLVICRVVASSNTTTGIGCAKDILNAVTIPNAYDIRGSITLPAVLDVAPDAVITWHSSNPNVISDQRSGGKAAGVVKRPPVGSKPLSVRLTCCITERHDLACKDFHVTVQPAVKLAKLSRYAMANFARSNSQSGQQIYMAYSVGNDATSWIAANDGHIYINSTKGMHAVRDPSIVRSPENDKFYMVATDLNVDGFQYGWQGWDWAQSGASRYIEVWESQDLRHWSPQRHVLVAPEEAGMTYAPEAIWDPEIAAYVVYWTSSLYAPGTRFTNDTSDALRRYPLTRNEIMYSTTRDFISFTPAQIMSGRPNHGTLDAVIIQNEEDGYYHRIVSDRISTGVNLTKYVSCTGEDIYQERSRSILAPANEWELVTGCITHDAMNTTYAEGPLVIKANPDDSRGMGYYMYADQKWAASPSGQPMEEQYNPYWSNSLDKPNWTPLNWTKKPEYDLALGVIRHGHIEALTTAEHAALRGSDLSYIAVKTLPTQLKYKLGEDLNLTGLEVNATYTDGVTDEDLSEGYGGYAVEGYNPWKIGRQNVFLWYSVLMVKKSAIFQVEVVEVE